MKRLRGVPCSHGIVYSKCKPCQNEYQKQYWATHSRPGEYSRNNMSPVHTPEKGGWSFDKCNQPDCEFIARNGRELREHKLEHFHVRPEERSLIPSTANYQEWVV